MQFRIWSNEHNGWWRQGAWGYTPNIAEAGFFSAEQTLRHLYSSACGSPAGKPKEIAVDNSGMRFILEVQRKAAQR